MVYIEARHSGEHTYIGCESAAHMDKIPIGRDVTVVEMFPRDGLQGLEPGEYEKLTTDVKIELIERMAECGFPEVEVASFAHPKVIPQLADAEAVIDGLSPRSDVTYSALVPNDFGLERAVETDIEKVCFLVTASESYQRKNANMSVEENLEQIAEMASMADERGLETSAAVGIGFICPYEGVMPDERIFEVFERLYDAGLREIEIADSVGMADPRQVYDRCSAILDRWPNLELGLHLHNRHGLALLNVLAGLQAGVDTYSSTIGGVGAGIAMPENVNRRLMGNVATEEVIRLMDRLSLDTGVDLNEVRELTEDIGTLIDYEPKSPVMQTGTLEEYLR